MKRALLFAGCFFAFYPPSFLHAGMQLQKLGLKIGALPSGPRNLISDVPGVRVGHATIHEGQGTLKRGKGPVRTGVTTILPAEGDVWAKPLPMATFTFNGVGEAAGFFNGQEVGILQTPIALTNTMSVGDVHKALATWVIDQHPEVESVCPFVLECDDSSLNDIHGFHVKESHVLSSIKSASADFAEGAVGAGTGMISYDFKSGIGSASRVVEDEVTKSKFTLGVILNSNLGSATRDVFRFLGVFVSRFITGFKKIEKPFYKKGAGSIVIVLATDAPFDSRQLQRLAKRSFSGVLRTGTPGYNGSGDFVLAYSTANRVPDGKAHSKKALPDASMNRFFEAAADATEEALLNSLLASTDTTGRDGNQVFALTPERAKILVSKMAH